MQVYLFVGLYLLGLHYEQVGSREAVDSFRNDTVRDGKRSRPSVMNRRKVWFWRLEDVQRCERTGYDAFHAVCVVGK